MRKNIFVKSMLRQTVRSLILLLLVAAASFAFIMRAVERIVVTEKIEGIGQYYRSIGYLQRTEGVGTFEDISTGAEIVNNSPYLGFEDKRRTVEAVLDGLQNTDIHGSSDNPAGIWRTTDNFFYGKLLSINYIPFRIPPHVERLELLVQVDSVPLGYAENLVAGQVIELRYILTGAELDTAKAAVSAYFEEHNDYRGDIEFDTALSGMTVGQRYFFRGVNYNGPAVKNQEDPNPTLIMLPLNMETTDRTRTTPEPIIWYAPAPEGKVIDSSYPGLEGLDAEYARLRYNQSAILISTSADMTSLPDLQSKYSSYKLASGRWINHEDYLNANPVVVVNAAFAKLRGLELGDTITVSIPREQHMLGFPDAFGTSIGAIAVAGIPEGGYEPGLKLEIVGMIADSSTGASAVPSARANYIYIPDSLLPSDLSFHRINDVFEQRGVPDGTDYLPQYSYSFVLRDARDEAAFLEENRGPLAAAGYDVLFVEDTGATKFWDSAEPILRSVTLNYVIFCVVLVLVLTLVVFLYLRQRQRDFAIARALGVPVRHVALRLLISLCILGLPAIIGGSAAGWYFALSRAANTINPFGEIANSLGFSLDLSISALWLPALIAAVLITLLIIAMIGTARLAVRPVLELLRGTSVTGNKPKSASEFSAASSPAVFVEELTAGEQRQNDAAEPVGTQYIPDARKAGTQWMLRFILRHISRALVKTILTAMVAVFFVIALCFLRESIDGTKKDVDRLYDTTIVNAEFRAINISNPVRQYGGVMRKQAVTGVLESDAATNVYIESNWQWSLVVPAAADGSLPENWKETIGYNSKKACFTSANLGLLNPLLAFDDPATFLSEHAQDNLGDIFHEKGVTIDYAAECDSSSFVYTDGEPIPVILSKETMEQRGLHLGDKTYIGRIFVEATFPSGLMERGKWQFLPAVVIGVHNGNLFVNANAKMQNSVFIPIGAMERIMGNSTGYSVLRFTIDPARNRDLNAINDALQKAVGNVYAGWGTSIKLFIYDEELRTVTGSMEQNLSLLRMLYPIAIALSVIIGFGLSLLLMLQSARNAAIMRVLGLAKKRSLIILCAEQLIVCLVGLILGLCAAAIAGWGFGASISLAALYLIGALIGSILGGILVTRKPPLELLQVRD